MTDQRIIKKYPNRRLYDTAISSYITLEDVKNLILEQTSVKVIDARSQNDITHSTLLQIVSEQEEKGPHLFSNEMLALMIRFYRGQLPQQFQVLLMEGIQSFNQHCFSKDDKPTLNQLEAPSSSPSPTDWQAFQTDWFARFQALAIRSSANESVSNEEKHDHA